MPRLARDTLIALAALAFALITLLLWIPLDIESGVLEKHRRTLYIGDAMLPTLVAGLILIVSVLMLLSRLFRPRSDAEDRFDRTALWFQLKAVIVIATALVIMFYLGSGALWLAAIAGVETGSYRELRDTVPWKYLGFVVGGSIMVAGLISLIEHRWRLRNIGIGVLACAILILIFDLPFEDLLLPPNGDY